MQIKLRYYPEQESPGILCLLSSSYNYSFEKLEVKIVGVMSYPQGLLEIFGGIKDQIGLKSFIATTGFDVKSTNLL